MEILSWFGFGLSAFVYITVFLLVIAIPNKTKIHYTLLFALLGGTAWSLQLLASRFYIIYDTHIFVAESLRLVSLLVFIASIIKVGQQQNRSFLLPLSIIFSLVLVALPIANSLYWLSKSTIFVGYLACTVLALVYLELLFKQAKKHLWSIKPMLLGLGTLLVFDFIIFADASLLQQVDEDMWLARGYLHSIFVPLLLISIKRTEALGIRVFISRDMVFQSSLLFATGLYLVLMAMAGYYIKLAEQQWSNLAQILFIVLAFTFLIFLFISDSVKRRFKVFIEKNFFANRFDYRERWLALTQIISKPLKDNESVYQRALQGFMSSVDYDQGALLKLNGHSLEVLTEKNMQLKGHSLQVCQSLILPYIQQKNWLIDMREYINSVQNYPGLIIPYNTALTIDYQAVIPVFEGETLWGLAILNNTQDPIHFNWEIRDYMKVVSMQLGSFISQFEANRSLTENAQFAAFNRTSAFVVHDLKNVLAQIRLILRNAEKHKHNPEFIEDTFETLTHTDSRMQKMLDQLMSKQSEEKLQQQFSVADLINKQVLPKTQKLKPEIEFIATSDFEYTLDSDRFASILFHLIDNAQHATEDSGKVKVSVSKQNGFGLIEVEDTGSGMTEEFVAHKLFAPFITTKGNAGMGIGAYDAKQFIESLNGKLTVTSTINVGSKFVILLPLS